MTHSKKQTLPRYHGFSIGNCGMSFNMFHLLTNKGIAQLVELGQNPGNV